MPFRDFVYPDVTDALRLSLAEADLFDAVPALALTPEFAERIHSGAEVAVNINSEKARSEFIVAPLLLELRRLRPKTFSIFSGIEFNVDASRSLNGFCDFILTRSLLQSVLKAPIMTIAEAKNDNIRSGLGQCIAAMVAAREFNALASTDPATIYGAVTTGSVWKFLKLVGSDLTLDRPEYSISEPGRVMGILAEMLKPVVP